MKIAVLKETLERERRVALVADSAAKLIAAGSEVFVESGAGLFANAVDESYSEAGANVR